MDLSFFLSFWRSRQAVTRASEQRTSSTSVSEEAHIRTAAFVAVDGVYNCEKVPSSKSQIPKYKARSRTKIRYPKSRRRANLLVIPSAEGSMTTDIEDERLIDWIREAAIAADWVITVCDGSFLLAATGLLDGRTATTFPSDRRSAGRDVSIHRRPR